MAKTWVRSSLLAITNAPHSLGLLFEQIMSGKYDFPAPYWTNISDAAKDLIGKLLQVDPKCAPAPPHSTQCLPLTLVQEALYGGAGAGAPVDHAERFHCGAQVGRGDEGEAEEVSGPSSEARRRRQREGGGDSLLH